MEKIFSRFTATKERSKGFQVIVLAIVVIEIITLFAALIVRSL